MVIKYLKLNGQDQNLSTACSRAGKTALVALPDAKIVYHYLCEEGLAAQLSGHLVVVGLDRHGSSLFAPGM